MAKLIPNRAILELSGYQSPDGWECSNCRERYFTKKDKPEIKFCSNCGEPIIDIVKYERRFI